MRRTIFHEARNLSRQMTRNLKPLAICIAILTASACSATTRAPEPSVAATAASGSQELRHADSARILADIAYLASDRLEGRLTGTPGNDSAAAYIARRFAELKLNAPYPGYLQRFAARS